MTVLYYLLSIFSLCLSLSLILSLAHSLSISFSFLILVIHLKASSSALLLSFKGNNRSEKIHGKDQPFLVDWASNSVQFRDLYHHKLTHCHSIIMGMEISFSWAFLTYIEWGGGGGKGYLSGYSGCRQGQPAQIGRKKNFRQN